MNKSYLFPSCDLAKGHKKKNKGNSEKPFVYWCLAVALRTRVSENLQCLYDRCVCVCVKTFSEIAKHKSLKDAKEIKFFCIAPPTFIFALIVILIINSKLSILN